MTVLDIVIDQPHDHMEVGGRTMPGAIVERTHDSMDAGGRTMPGAIVESIINSDFSVFWPLTT